MASPLDDPDLAGLVKYAKKVFKKKLKTHPNVEYNCVLTPSCKFYANPKHMLIHIEGHIARAGKPLDVGPSTGGRTGINLPLTRKEIAILTKAKEDMKKYRAAVKEAKMAAAKKKEN